MPQTGPQTELGKRNSSLNSLRHGIFTQHILRCKKERCFYAQLCPLCQNDQNEHLAAIKVGDACPLEAKHYQALADELMLNKQNNSRDLSELEKEMIMTTLQIRRAQMLISLNPEIERSIPSKYPGYNRPALTLGIRYRLELGRKLVKQLTQLYEEQTENHIGSAAS